MNTKFRKYLGCSVFINFQKKLKMKMEYGFVICKCCAEFTHGRVTKNGEKFSQEILSLAILKRYMDIIKIPADFHEGILKEAREAGLPDFVSKEDIRKITLTTMEKLLNGLTTDLTFET